MKMMSGSVESGSGRTSLDLSLETGNSTFSIKSKADCGFSDLISDPSVIKKASLSVTDTKISLKDILYFKSDLRSNKIIAALERSPFIFDASLNLKDSVINISDITIRKDNMKLGVSGDIRNAFIKGRQGVNLKVGIPDLDMAWLSSILKESGKKIDFPDIKDVSFAASVAGSLKSAEFGAMLSGDLGKTDITGTMSYDDDMFYVKSVFTDISAGKLINNPLLGSFDGSVEARGSGIRHKDLSANILATIDSLGLKGYEYTGIKLECNIKKQDYNVNLNINDPALACNISASLNTADSILDMKAEGRLSAQVNKLNLFKDTLKVEGNLKAGFKKIHDKIESELTVIQTKITTPSDYSILPDTKISFSSDSSRTVLNARSNFFNANVQIEKSINEYSQILQGYKKYAETFVGPAYLDRSTRVSFLPEMKADIKISPHKAIWMIINDTSFHFSDFEFRLLNDPATDEINYKIKGRSFKYKSINIGSFNTSLSDSAGKMSILTRADSLTLFSRHISKITIDSHFSNLEGITELSVFDKPDSILYDFNIKSVLDSTGIEFEIPSKQLIMNRTKWIMDSPELMSYNRALKICGSFLKNAHSRIFRQYSVQTGSAGLHT